MHYKSAIGLALSLIVLLYLGRVYSYDIPIYFMCFVVALQLLNNLQFNKIKGKKWILSPLNMVTSKKNFTFSSDLQKTDLFELVNKILLNRNFEIFHSEPNYQIAGFQGDASLIAVTGTNVYLRIEENGAERTIHVDVAMINAFFSWGKLGTTYEALLIDFENELTV